MNSFKTAVLCYCVPAGVCAISSWFATGNSTEATTVQCQASAAYSTGAFWNTKQPISGQVGGFSENASVPPRQGYTTCVWQHQLHRLLRVLSCGESIHMCTIAPIHPTPSEKLPCVVHDNSRGLSHTMNQQVMDCCSRAMRLACACAAAWMFGITALVVWALT